MKFYNLNKWKLRIFVRYSLPPSAPEEYIMFCVRHIGKDEDPDPVGSADFWPVGSGFKTFFIGSGSFL